MKARAEGQEGCEDQKVLWNELLGFDQDKQKLKELVHSSQLPSVILFEGRTGIGKSSLLFYLGALHFCEKHTACGECSACLMISHNKHPDFLVIQGGGDALKVASIADIGEFVAYAPQSNSPFAKRVVIIVDAENLTTSAVNKLLKTLEEPPHSARIFLSTARTKYLLTTLLSRCVRWHLKPPVWEDVQKIVARRFSNMSTDFEKQLKDLAARFGNAPAKILQCLERGQKTEEASSLLQSRKVGDILAFAENFKQQAEAVSLMDFVSEFEFALNKLYKEALHHRDFSTMGHIVSRRKFLRELRELLYEKKTPVNPQMVLEKLGFFNLKIPVSSDGRF